jgi:predicted Zn-dependent protease
LSPYKSKLENALQLIDSVVKRWPRDASYRDMRGQVLIKLERWEAALKDLEYALPKMNEDPLLHFELAITYETFGESRLSEMHEKIAELLTKGQATQEQQEVGTPPQERRQLSAVQHQPI